MAKIIMKAVLFSVLFACAVQAADEAWFGAPIPASGEDGRETAA